MAWRIGRGKHAACPVPFSSPHWSADLSINVWDTVGNLGEPAFSDSNYPGALGEACDTQLGAQGGLDLLLFCMRGSRVTGTMQSNYRLFFEVLCEEQIPIATGVTHLEDEERPMEDWWAWNEKHLSKGGMKFSGHACTTGKRGHANSGVESRSTLELLLLGYDNEERYPMPSASSWFSGFLERLPHIPRQGELKDKRKELEQVLIKRCEMDLIDAQKLTKTITCPTSSHD